MEKRHNCQCFLISMELTDKGKTPNERDLHTNFTVILWFLYFDICAVSENSYENFSRRLKKSARKLFHVRDECWDSF